MSLIFFLIIFSYNRLFTFAYMHLYDLNSAVYIFDVTILMIIY